MVSRILAGSVAVCTLLTLGRVADAQPAAGQNQNRTLSQNQQVTVPFSDPSRPGTVKVSLLSGSITVRAGSGRDVIVDTSPRRDPDDAREQERERERQEREREREERNRARGRDDEPSTAGLRRLTQPVGVNITEENNTVTVSAPVMNGFVNVTLQVPAATSLELKSVNGGQITVEGVNGSIDVNNVNGAIQITDVGGPVVAHATNGRVTATLRQIAADKPMSFTSFNGNVDVTVPASAKANLKLRSDRGDVYTDFDVQTTAAPSQSSSRDADRRRDDTRDARGGTRYRLEVDRAIYGTINGGGADFELRTFNGNIYLRKAK
jgi:hypothetical protein